MEKENLDLSLARRQAIRHFKMGALKCVRRLRGLLIEPNDRRSRRTTREGRVEGNQAVTPGEFGLPFFRCLFSWLRRLSATFVSTAGRSPSSPAHAPFPFSHEPSSPLNTRATPSPTAPNAMQLATQFLKSLGYQALP